MFVMVSTTVERRDRSQPVEARPLGFVDCLALGINGIIGSGIFFLPAVLQNKAGSWSWLSWLVVGGLCIVVALCFAEAASRTRVSGGPYRYAVDAFGAYAGFAVGWITLTSSVLGYAAVARGFAEHGVALIGASTEGPWLVALVLALVAGLGALNAWGVRLGARTGDVVGAAKLVALAGFVVLGTWALAHSHAVPVASVAPPMAEGVVGGAMAGLFACTGFEYVPVPAGETRRPERSVGLAMVLSLVVAVGVYALVQRVFSGVAALSPSLVGSKTPLSDAAGFLGGPLAQRAVSVLALISAFGFCSGSALVAPRYIESFALDGFLPRLFGRRWRRGTPVWAIVAVSSLVVALAGTLDFASLADVSTLAVVAQYGSTCAAVLVLRRRRGRAPFTLPLGPLLPLLGLAGCVVFVSQVARGELLLASALLLGGALVATLSRARR